MSTLAKQTFDAQIAALHQQIASLANRRLQAADLIVALSRDEEEAKQGLEKIEAARRSLDKPRNAKLKARSDGE